MDKEISTAEAAKIIDCVDSRVRQLLREGLLKGRRVGRDWLVSERSAKKYRDTDRKRGPKPGKKEGK